MPRYRWILIALLLPLIPVWTFAQPDWPAIKAAAAPVVAFPDAYEAPYAQPLSVGGWEDGIYITRDGLNLYCIYLPIDSFSFLFLGAGDISNYSSYARGPTFGMDLTTNPAGASEWLHGDILYARRESVEASFTEWQLSNLARPVWSEGAVQIVLKDSETADIFIYGTNHDPPPSGADDTDILIFRDSPLNPEGVGDFMPAPARSDLKEDNPHIERLDDQNLVLFFDSDRPGTGALDIWYTVSSDDGVSWSEPVETVGVNTAEADQMPHLWQDEDGSWYLYYASPDPVTDKLQIYRARQTEAGNWTSWTDVELVIGAGNLHAVAEPTLTEKGDISFVVVYDAGETATETDRFDADAWYLPRKASSCDRASDFDGDGGTGFNDFLLFVPAFGRSADQAEFSEAHDLDCDGTVGFPDFLIFAAAFGK